MFGALYSVDGSADDVLLGVAADFTPRFERTGPREMVLDLSGLERLFGGLEEIGGELCRAAAARQARVRVAVAATCTAARLLARADSSEQVVTAERGAEAAAIAGLPVDLLTVITTTDSAPSHLRTLAPSHPAPSHPRTPAPSHPMAPTLHRWGIRTLGALAALPADAVAARLGAAGTRWQRLARGEDLRPLRPEVAEERFEQAMDLEWPIDGLEPLSFVLGRLLEPLAAHLDRRGRSAAALHLRLDLVTRTAHERSLQLPAPMRDARTFRTLLLLDLESHPPAAAIDRVAVAVEPTPPRVVQFSLLTRPLPSPEQLSTLMARLTALMGEGRCGSPAAVDSWEPGACAMKPFAPRDASVIRSHETRTHRDTEVKRALRRFRVPIPVRVRIENDTPLHVTAGLGSGMSGHVKACAGPWRTSGRWWTDPDRPQRRRDTEKTAYGLCVSGSLWPVGGWDRDEWDVTLGDGATYRMFRDRATSAWFLEGIYD